MCCLHLQGASRIDWGIEKCQLCRIIARFVLGKSKSKGLPNQGHEGPEGVTCIAPLSLISALDVGGWSTPRPGTVRVPIVDEAGWAQGRSGRVRKISSPEEFDPRSVQPVALHNGHIPFYHSFQNNMK
jgi:hypothetical protein